MRALPGAFGRSSAVASGPATRRNPAEDGGAGRDHGDLEIHRRGAEQVDAAAR